MVFWSAHFLNERFLLNYQIGVRMRADCCGFCPVGSGAAAVAKRSDCLQGLDAAQVVDCVVEEDQADGYRPEMLLEKHAPL